MKTGNPSTRRYTVTSALPYANGPAHIGHLAGAYLPADIYVRYLRSQGNDVLFVSGTDEHGTTIDIKARAEGISPQEVVDKYHGIISETFKKFNISFDVFSRTSNPTHRETAQEFFKKFHEEGKLIKETSEQLYDPEQNMFLADRFVVGTCPNCGNEDAYGNQCEKCGKDLSPSELINPRSKVSGATPVMKETSHWYLPLNDYQDWLEEYILKGHSDWKANVYGQCKSWLQDGLKPRAITRDMSWGVPVPVEGGEGKVLYVWFDAPIGYISATKEWAEANNKDWKTYWQDEGTELVHFIGKDNIVFHCIIFPAMLKGHGDFVLPTNVPANEFLNLEGNKISTSRNWAIWMHEFAEEFPDQIDTMRYVLTAIMPETKDSEFTWQEYKTRNDTELVATFANFVNRVKVLTLKNFDGVPARLALNERDQQLIDAVHAAKDRAAEALENFRFRDALNEMMIVARSGDAYLSELEPWHLVKKDPVAAGHVLNLGLNVAAVLATVASPFLPETSEKIFKMLNREPLNWTQLEGFDFVAEGTQLENIAHLFKKIDQGVVDAQVAKLQATAATVEVEEVEEEAGSLPALKEETTFDAFQGMDLRLGTILEASPVPKTNKLLQFKVDTGLDQRTIVSGVAQHFKPEELVGKQVMVLANLQPRKIRGVVSQGMILFAEDATGKLHLVNPEYPVQNGSSVN